MWKMYFAAFVVAGLQVASAEEAARIDFVRDVQPLFKGHCTSCHGPKQQKNGFRLDRRRDALRAGMFNQIGPGNAEASHLYFRLVGDRDGPTSRLKGLGRDQIKVLKASGLTRAPSGPMRRPAKHRPHRAIRRRSTSWFGSAKATGPRSVLCWRRTQGRRSSKAPAARRP